MKGYQAIITALAVSCACAVAEDVELSAIQSGGLLSWSAASGSVCSVEWAADLQSNTNWHRSWNDVSGILMEGTGTSVEVPMFYRIACDTNPMSMITPYVRKEDMYWVRQGYSTTTNCPWGFIHDGIDFQPVSNMAPFHAVCDGTIMDVVLRHAPPVDGGKQNWDVYVVLRYNSDYAVTYNFEPKTTNLADGIIQLTNIFVSLLEPVTQRQVIGYLHMGDPSAHIHFGLVKHGYAYHNGVIDCPAPFFNEAAQDSILSLITQRFPTATAICY